MTNATREFKTFSEGFDAVRRRNVDTRTGDISKTPLVGWVATYGMMWEKYRFFPSGRLEHWDGENWTVVEEHKPSGEAA